MLGTCAAAPLLDLCRGFILNEHLAAFTFSLILLLLGRLVLLAASTDARRAARAIKERLDTITFLYLRP